MPQKGQRLPTQLLSFSTNPRLLDHVEQSFTLVEAHAKPPWM